MWDIYLPVAQISVNTFLILFMGILNGLFAGLFGIGGSFISIPLMITMGISPPVCVSTTACQMITTSTSGTLHQRKTGMVDSQVMIFLLCGIVLGVISGTYLLDMLEAKGLVDICIAFSYVFIIGSVGVLMFNDSFKAIYYKYKGTIRPTSKPYLDYNAILSYLPLKSYFIGSQIEVSILIPIFAGFVSGILLTMAGIAIQFLLVPILLYVLKMPLKAAFGTTAIAGLIGIIIAVFSQAIHNYTIDIVLALILVVGALIGIQIGGKLHNRVPPEVIKLVLSSVILVVVFKMLLYLFLTPKSLYSVVFTNK